MLTNLWQLLRNVATDKHSLEVNPQVLDGHPVLQDVGRVRQVMNPLLDVLLEWCVVPASKVSRITISRGLNVHVHVHVRVTRMQSYVKVTLPVTQQGAEHHEGIFHV